MRQAGIIAAGGLYALKYHVSRLSLDHKHASELEACLMNLPWIKEIYPVETNIVVAVLTVASDRDQYIDKLKQHGILCIAFGPGMIRFVTHLDISEQDIQQTISVLKSL
jgi:threonine aldolase